MENGRKMVSWKIANEKEACFQGRCIYIKTGMGNNYCLKPKLITIQMPVKGPIGRQKIEW